MKRYPERKEETRYICLHHCQNSPFGVESITTTENNEDADEIVDIDITKRFNIMKNGEKLTLTADEAGQLVEGLKQLMVNQGE